MAESENPAGGQRRLPTASGETLGISVEDRAGQYGPYQVVLYDQGAQREDRAGQYGPYQVVLYDQGAQRFIVDNVDAIMAFAAGKDTRT